MIGRSQPELGSRLARLGAAGIDWALAVAVGLSGILGAFSWGSDSMLRAAASPGSVFSLATADGTSRLLTAGSLAGSVVLVLYQWFGLATRGQTIGKRLLGIQVVDSAGAPAGLLRAVVVRSWLFGLLLGLVQLPLGAFGALLPFVNLLPIFGVERRCLHDRLAGTWVRQAPGSALGALPALAIFLAGSIGLGALAVQTGMQQKWQQASRVLQSAVERTPGAKGLALPEKLGMQPPGSGSRGEVVIQPPKATGTLYRYEDDAGTLHFTEDLSTVPERFRGRARPID